MLPIREYLKYVKSENNYYRRFWTTKKKLNQYSNIIRLTLEP
jgi:hypothetical protein